MSRRPVAELSAERRSGTPPRIPMPNRAARGGRTGVVRPDRAALRPHARIDLRHGSTTTRRTSLRSVLRNGGQIRFFRGEAKSRHG